MKAQAGRIRSLESAAAAEQKAAAPTLVRTLSRLFGPEGSDNKSLAELKTANARLDAFNDLLAEKGCPKLDTAALITTPEATTVAAAKPLASPVASSPASSGPAIPVADVTGLDRPILSRGY